MSKLNVYRASAGSGKTYRLTEEYLRLLFKNNMSYKNILSVTFTHKATDEMKTRIIEALYKLSNADKFIKVDYYNEFKKEFNLNDKEIKQKSATILARILHDYSRFSVGTIDSFFQKVIRAFVREIGLQYGFNIDLDIDKVLSEAVNNLFLDIDDDKDLRNWLLEFINDKIKDGKSWKIYDDVFNLSKSEIFKEDFQLLGDELVNKLSDKDFLNNYLLSIKDIQKNFKNDLQEIGKKGIKIISDNGLSVDDFTYGKSGFANYFNKLYNKSDFIPGKRVLDAQNVVEKWYKKNSTKIAEITTVYDSGLNNLLVEAVQYYCSNKEKYNTAKEIYQQFFTLGILSDVSKKIKNYCKENNIFLISNSAVLLNKIIDGSDTPFIYEKIGNYYQHFMIDEFQDTSKLQWNNFKPLIDNSLADNNTSLVVGDVKQSIYRWRNGDWKLLSQQINKDFQNQGIDDSNPLKTNWRSKKNVIDFNNSFFNYAAGFLQNFYNQDIPEVEVDESLKTEIVDAYKDVFQNIPKTKQGGYINVSFLENTKENKFDDNIEKELPKVIEQLQDNNYQLNDIAILVRTKKEAGKISSFLLKYKNEKINSKYKYDVISNESLYISNSFVVAFILLVLKYFVNPNDDINNANIVYQKINYISNNEFDNDKFNDIFLQISENQKDVFDKFLPNEFTQNINKLKQLTLYELVENIISIFKLNNFDVEISFLQAFQNIVFNFVNNDSADLSLFLKWWDEFGIKETIKSSDEQKAIRILTIHKSKGLQFKAVIVPYCNWLIDNDTTHKKNIWCKPNSEPFNKLDLVPVKYSQKLVDTIFYKDYFNEKLQAFVDNLNLLYVAFTRAEESLFAFSPLKEKDEVKNVGDVIFKCFNNKSDIETTQEHEGVNIADYWNDETKVFSMGSLSTIETNITKKDTNDFCFNKYLSNTDKNRLRLKFHSNEFFSEVNIDSKSHINKGTIMHQIFEYIYTEKDIEKAVNQVYFEGKIDDKEKQEITTQIKQLLKDDKIKSWFSPEWQVKNETDILLNDGKVKRPDRVLIGDNEAIVIDYKFVNEEKPEYVSQVSNYVSYLLKMGYENVKGYIWYVNQNNVVEV
ncbi:MAG: UvrD-helicase domain-containing protein [Bacteroidetes bacterium]|nr:UvrD-helicase domain-containing protein [Bacteroidota bacterium]